MLLPLHVFSLLLTAWFAQATANIKNEKCRYCNYLCDTFQWGMKKTANQHFAGGDTAWEEKNLGKYATSETRFIEVMEGVCKKKTLPNTDNYNGLSELEFKCSTMMEDAEETIEEYYYKHQSNNMSGWLCISQLKVCCPDGHFGRDCNKCPGLEATGRTCNGKGKCHGDGSREGTGKCNCETGYVGHQCQHCSSDYFSVPQPDSSISCEKCYEACTGGCKAAGPTGCNHCRSGWLQDPEKGCIDIDECLDKTKCTKEHEKCVNSHGSFSCECETEYMREGDKCVLDIRARPYESWMRPDKLLRTIAWTALAAIITLVVWRRSVLLMVMSTITVILILIVEVNVNPDTIPDMAKEFLPHS